MDIMQIHESWSLQTSQDNVGVVEAQEKLSNTAGMTLNIKVELLQNSFRGNPPSGGKASMTSE